jgi:hypothetical protein
MRWFLYDETARERAEIEHVVPLDAIRPVRGLLESVNPYVSTIRYALDQVEDDGIPATVELKHLAAGGELAAIINTQNLMNVHPRKVMFFRSGSGTPRYVHILSRHSRMGLALPFHLRSAGKSATGRIFSGGQLADILRSSGTDTYSRSSRDFCSWAVLPASMSLTCIVVGFVVPYKITWDGLSCSTPAYWYIRSAL